MKPASTRIARLVVRVLARIIGRLQPAAADAPPPPRPWRPDDDLAVAHDAGARDDLVLEVELQRPVLADEQLQQREHVAREQLRGVLGHACAAG